MSKIPNSGPDRPLAASRDSLVSVAYGDDGPVSMGRRSFLALPELPPTPPATTPSPRAPAKLDDATLLAIAPLTLSKELRVSVAHAGRVIVKYNPGRAHLVLTPLQWAALETFEGGRTVPAALKQLLDDGRTVPLCEFYELVLKACDQGILQTPGHPIPAPVDQAGWRFSLPGKVVRVVAVTLVFTWLIFLVLKPLVTPGHWLWWIPAWALICLASSAGAVLSAMVVNAVDGDLYNPRFIRRSLFPRFAIDHEDALFGGRQVEIDAALAQITPFLGFTTIATWWAPPLALPLFLGLLWSLVPIGKSPGNTLLRAWRHAPRTSAAADFRFKPNQTLLHRIRQHRESNELRFAFLRIGFGVLWLVLLTLGCLKAADLDFVEVWETQFTRYIANIALWEVAVLVGLGLAGALVVGLALVAEHVRLRKATREQQETRELASLKRPAPDMAGLIAFLGETHPFLHLPIKRRELIAEVMRQTPFAAGETVINAGDKLTRLYIVFSGSVRTATAGVPNPTNVFPAGAIVGESVLFQGGEQAAAIIGVVPGIIVSVNREAYEDLIAPFVPQHKIEDAIQKVSFLRQISLSRHWPAYLLDSFSRRAVVHSFGYSSVILETGRENLWFYVVQEGELRVMRNGRKISRLRPGDFFGEISLLQNSLTTADVVGHVPGRYLAIPRHDFLAFLAQDHEIAMQFEAIASRRLGHPVFPL